jgi:hypothetical protein
MERSRIDMARWAIVLGLMAALSILPATAAHPQEPVERVAAADAALDRLADAGAALWPSFRVDTIPVVWSFPGDGWALTGWSDDTLPTGFEPTAARGVAWKPTRRDGPPGADMISLGERGWAFVPAADLGLAAMIGLGAHEAFHVWQRSARDEGRYRAGENSALVIEYPEFDSDTEAGFALEGRLLAAALAGQDADRVRDLAWAFVAARESRHRRIGAELAGFEEDAELNEGIAQYVYLEAIELAGEHGDVTAEAVADEVGAEMSRLGSALIDDAELSLRRRFYTTGSALARLLDRLAGDGWKAEIGESGLSLHAFLALSSGYRAREDSLVRIALERHGEGLQRRAEDVIAARRERRADRRRQVLAAEGLRVELQSPQLGLCGFDPQNLLRLADDQLLHMRWIRFCLPGGTAEFETPVVQDREAGTAVAVLSDADGVEISAGGRPLGMEALPDGPVEGLVIAGSGLRLEVARARLSRRDGALIVSVGG